ncbi:CHRD domain-containing protein [Novosphingobium lentum]|uniref:CHRD domain-containing protein n=1 Tax=Novosphingobium lentum TaxID=145287 RepID=UPI00082FBE77|nr:CHRD domain-containing protein [Novosphingobium lentum]
MNRLLSSMTLPLATVLLPASALAAPVVLTATLTGAAETAGGDADGAGTFRAEADPDSGDFCYKLTGDKIAKPTMAHVHTGAAGADGPPLATIDVTGPKDDECVAMEPAKIKDIVANPAGYYVNIHTADYPKGALRGQLAKQ